jgi:hypothetical protein
VTASNPPPPSRFKNRAEARRRFGALADELAGGLLRGDPLADDLVAHTRDRPVAIEAAFGRALAEGSVHVKRCPKGVRPLLRALERPSEDPWETIDRGAAALARCGTFSLLTMSAGSLVADYSSEAFARPLAKTGNLVHHAHRRMARTGAWWLSVITPGGLRVGAPGYRNTARIRLIHARVRNRLVADSWDTSVWGVPINQADMGWQLTGFSYLPLRALTRLGFRFSPAEIEGVYALWRHIGRLLGVEERFVNRINAHDARSVWHAHFLTNPGPCVEGQRMAQAALSLHLSDGTLGSLRERWIDHPLQRAFTWRALESVLCDQLDIRRPRLQSIAPLALGLPVLRRELARKLPGGERQAVAAGLREIAAVQGQSERHLGMDTARVADVSTSLAERILGIGVRLL